MMVIKKGIPDKLEVSRKRGDLKTVKGIWKIKRHIGPVFEPKI